jgi:uncharacterized alpha-E superfamily protein
MLSRVADSIYWMSRYIERAENSARFIDVNLNLSMDLREETNTQWEPLVMTTGDDALFKTQYGNPTKENVIRFLTFDTKNPNSILSCVLKARENARTVREMIPTEAWEQINHFFLMVRDAVDSGRAAKDPHGFFTSVKMASHLFTGITDATMSHGEGWHFIRVGRFLERADKTSRILDVKYFILLPSPGDVGTNLDHIQWAALLKSASALQMYRKQFGPISPFHVVEFLILDRLFPRAVHYCLIRVEHSLNAISGSAEGTFQNPAEKRVGQLRSLLDYTDIEDIISKGLHEFLDNLQSRLNGVGAAVSEMYFSPRAAPEMDRKSEGQ